MEVFLYNSTICRLCGEENDNGTLLYLTEENTPSLCETINKYLPIEVVDDGQLPRTICPGCTIQLEATVEFMNLIINGQKIIRELYQREREYKKSLVVKVEDDDGSNKIIADLAATKGVYTSEHPIALQVAGLEKPRRKRGRPPKKTKTPQELADEVAAAEKEQAKKQMGNDEEISGKRRRKTPTRFKEVVQGKELDRIFKEEGVTDGEESDQEVKGKGRPPPAPEVIGHMETSGELVVVVRGKGRGRPKGRVQPSVQQCAICGMQFSCGGRYMAHVAGHGPVRYQCATTHCLKQFTTRLAFTEHQERFKHEGQTVIPWKQEDEQTTQKSPTNSEASKTDQISEGLTLEPSANSLAPQVVMTSLPDLSDKLVSSIVLDVDAEVKQKVSTDGSGQGNTQEQSAEVAAIPLGPKGKPKLKCPHCDKLFSSKQSKSLHIKGVHNGERPYVCAECGCRFAYPRSLALHQLSHRRHRGQRRYACDLCGKVLNHPSSVVYHKEAEHAGQRYVCNKCGKCFKHRQLLQRHQLVHSQLRPYSCKTCNASFKTKANLLNHQLLHTGVKRFACSLCKHRFAHKTSLTLHMRWHTGTKPYVCKTCNKSFSQKGNLSEHERTHTGEKPYECSTCSRRFTTASQRRLHARHHLPERPYSCTHCHKKFVSLGSWSAHQRRAGASGAGCGAAVCPHCARPHASRWALQRHLRRHHQRNIVEGQPEPAAAAVTSPAGTQRVAVNDVTTLNTSHKKSSRQTSLLAEPALAGERVIYVTYDAPGSEPAFHILDTEQETIEEDNVSISTLYGAGLEEGEEGHEEYVLDGEEQISVTDEQGNPLHFTMQDGTRLAITSCDGQSLQVVTQDGQTIPVEINGFNEEEEETLTEGTIIHQLDLQKSESGVTSPVTYFTIV